jgi:hypothetical protein
MKLLALLVLAGCYQMTLYTGPRVDSSGNTSWELGASFGGARPTRSGAVALSFEGSAPVSDPTKECPASGCAVARSTASTPSESRVAVHGLLEWISGPLLPPRDLQRTSRLPWRAGVYAGFDRRMDGANLGSIGGMAAVSPLILYAHTRNDRRSLALGLQVATDVTPGDGRVVGHAAIACDMHFLPRWW